MRDDVREARRVGRILIAGAIGYIAVSVLLWLARPGFFGPDDGLRGAFDAAGFATMLIGLGWMVRIYRADPEPDEPAWRYGTSPRKRASRWRRASLDLRR